MATSKKPTLKELIDRIQRDLDSNAKLTSLRKSWNFILARVLAAQFFLVYAFFWDNISRMLPWNIDGEYTPFWAQIYDVQRKEASFAVRKIKVLGANGSFIASGTEMQDDDGLEFTTMADALIASGEALILVVCATAGIIGNKDAGSTLKFIVPIAGVQTSATVEEDGMIDGQDQETIEALHGRFIEKVQAPAHGGNESDYERWAKEVAGVTRAWVYPERMGEGTVGVCFVMDNKADDFIPSPAEVANVQAYIQAAKPVTADVYVFAPIAEPVDFEIEAVPNTPAVRAAIIEELKDLFIRESVPEGSMFISHVREAISLASGENDHVLVSPTTNISADTGKIRTLGNITWV